MVELLSPGTEKEDLGQTLRPVDQPPTKWQVYEQVLRVPYYVVFDRYTDTFQAFTLQADRYSELPLEQPKLWMPSLAMGLGLWPGTYQGIDRLWLCWYNANGWIPTPTEREQTELQQERQRSERLAARLRSLGVDPEQV